MVDNLFSTEVFCDEIADIYRNDDWRLSYKQEPIVKVDKDVFNQVLESVSDLENLPDMAQRS